MAFGPFSIPFKLDRTRAASAQAYDHLRELITTMTLAPGTPLDRGELEDYFKLSSTPVRDALTRLRDENLVDIYPQHATMVRAIDITSLHDAHLLRLSLELEVAASLARRRDAALVHTLEGLVSQQAFALSRQDYDNFTRLDMAFHQQLFSAALVEDLWRLVRSMSGNMDRLRRLHVPLADKGQQVLADHAGIVGAIAGGDEKMAQAAVRKHLSGTLAQLDALVARYPGYFIEPGAP
jgi:GntR family transcriptional regulator, rspAB operon transcriptional repressor